MAPSRARHIDTRPGEISVTKLSDKINRPPATLQLPYIPHPVL